MLLIVTLPKNFTACPDQILAGLAGRINYQVVEQIKNRARYSGFSAWGVSGKIWWEEKTKQWCAEINKKETKIGTIRAEVIEDLVFRIQKQYGWK